MFLHIAALMDARRNKPSLSFFSSLLFIVSFNFHLINGSDSITPTQPLSAPRNITSQGGTFELGFFTPGKSQNYYIGIWYKRVSEQTVVWVANRETPLPNTTNSILKISQQGNLVLLSSSNLPVWSTNLPSVPSNSTVAVLQDDGNLVLRDGSNSSRIHWQSFDHPTHTWLPKGWLGLNKNTGKNQRLISWKNAEDPAPGPFSLEIDPGETSQYFLLWNGTKTYWKSGNWSENEQAFSSIPVMRPNNIYKFNFTNDRSHKYTTYSFYDESFISRLIMDNSGQVKQFNWLKESNKWTQFFQEPSAQCSVYALCGAFGICNEDSNTFCSCLNGFKPYAPKDWSLSSWSGGCVRNDDLGCRQNGSANSEKDGFWTLPDVKLPVNPQSLAIGTAEECKLACLNNCSCTAYAFDGSCSIWKGDLFNLQQLSDGDAGGRTLYLSLAASELQVSGAKDLSSMVLVSAIVGAVLVMAVALFSICRWRWRRSAVSLKVAQGFLIAFSYRDLQLVTKNFSEKLGGGGFGSVFKGILPDLSTVAVKKLEGLQQGEKQFRAEVRTIGNIQHVNLIRLRGFCSEGDKRLLVYDCMPNGSLDVHLFHENSEVLNWSTRYQIAMGIAKGIAYLHEKCRECIIHCNIKPENILLDNGFIPKVADFGLAKLIEREFSRVLTTIRGTRGYLAPEWISGLAITPKADVYSYGMMLFEIISGRRNTEQSGDGKKFFPYWAMKKFKQGELHCLLDKRLEGNANMEELNQACRVAGWCIQDHENDRPTMGQIVQILEGVLDVNMPPIPRSLQILAENQYIPCFFESSGSSQALSDVSMGSPSEKTTTTGSKE